MLVIYIKHLEIYKTTNEEELIDMFSNQLTSFKELFFFLFFPHSILPFHH